jgi:hypothetical protein
MAKTRVKASEPEGSETAVAATAENAPAMVPSQPSAAGDKKLPTYKVGPIATSKGESVSVTVWSNDIERSGETFTVYNVTVQASYFDASDGQWKASKGFRGSQLPTLIYALQRAFDFIMSQREPANQCPF